MSSSPGWPRFSGVTAARLGFRLGRDWKKSKGASVFRVFLVKEFRVQGMLFRDLWWFARFYKDPWGVRLRVTAYSKEPQT